jgi:thiol:disulfide interchange protein
MGFLSALIVGPCVAPPLAGALIYIHKYNRHNQCFFGTYPTFLPNNNA